MLFWGLSWPTAKVLVGIGEPFIIGFLRFFTAFVLFSVASIYFLEDKSVYFKKENIIGFFLLGFTGIFGYGVFFLFGMKFTTSAQGAIIAGINPATVSIFAFLIHGEKLDSNKRYIGFIISFIGVLFVIGVTSLINFRVDYLIGNILIVIAMICWGLYSSIGKNVMKSTSSFVSTTGAVFFGMVFFFIGAVFENEWQNLPKIADIFWLGIIFLGAFVTFLGFFFYFYAIKDIGATKSSIFINLVPIFGTFFSYILLAEPIYWTFLVGLVLIITGILIINYPTKKQSLQKRIRN